MISTVTVFEPIFSEKSVPSDPAFLPYLTNPGDAWREVSHIVKAYRRKLYLTSDFTGLFSAKFRLKTRITGDEFISFVQKHGGMDVYIANPFPQLSYYSFNVWMQGEIAHPGLIKRAQSLLDACGIRWNLANVGRQNHHNLCYSNFWIASEKFWDAYVGGILVPIVEFLEKNPASKEALDVFEDTVHTEKAPFLPFIIERLFSTYLSENPSIRVLPYPLYDNMLDYCTSDFERDIVQYMKLEVDTADRSPGFSRNLFDLMYFLCNLHQKYFWDHFSVYPHPHTGRIVNRAIPPVP